LLYKILLLSLYQNQCFYLKKKNYLFKNFILSKKIISNKFNNKKINNDFFKSIKNNLSNIFSNIIKSLKKISLYRL